MPDEPKFMMRLPSFLHQTCKASAATNNRSMNAELVFIIKKHYDTPPAEVGASMQKSKTLTVRLTDEVHARLQGAAKLGPYEISLTTIVERGIELAAQELERMGKQQ